MPYPTCPGPIQAALRRLRPALPALITCLIVACSGLATSALQVSATTATLAGYGSCANNNSANPCTTWFQYWRDNATTLVETPDQQGSLAFASAPITQAISGLTPGALYHYQLCGYGDTDNPQPGLCVGQAGGNVLTAPGHVPAFQPSQPGGSVYTYNLSATGNFATANPGAILPLAATIDLGRVAATADTSDYRNETAPSNAISRDAGYSIPYGAIPGNSLWLFGDTIYDCLGSSAAQNCRFAAGSTAASGPATAGQAPQALQDLVPAGTTAASAAASPASFFPTPAGLQLITPVGGVNVQVDCAPASVAGSISGTTLTIGILASGVIQIGQSVTGAGVLPGTTVTRQLSGTTGKLGTYAVSQAQTLANEPLFITYSGGNYTATWPRGGAQMPGASKLLLAYADVCINGASGFVSQRLHLVEYDPAANLLSNDTVPFTAAPMINGLNPRELLSSPVFGADGYLYLYSFTNVCMNNAGCAHAPTYPNAVYAARVSADPLSLKWKNGANFEWWCGTASPCPAGASGSAGWTGVEADARSVVNFPVVTQANGLRVQQGPFGQISVGNYTARSAQTYVVTAQTPAPAAGQPVEFMVFEGSTPYGPFTYAKAGAVPDACKAVNNCYAVIGHPELSTSKQLAFSWFSTDDRLDSFPYPLNGHVRLGAMDW